MRNAAYLLNPFELEAYRHDYDLGYVERCSESGAQEWRRFAKMTYDERIAVYEKWRSGEVEWFSKLLCVRAHAGTRRLLLSYYTSPLLHLKRQLFRSCLIGHLFFQLQRYNIIERNARFSPTTCPTFFRQIY